MVCYVPLACAFSARCQAFGSSFGPAAAGARRPRALCCRHRAILLGEQQRLLKELTLGIFMCSSPAAAVHRVVAPVLQRVRMLLFLLSLL